MFHCSPISFAPQADILHSPTLSPINVEQPSFDVPQPSAYRSERASLSPSEPASTTFSSDNERIFSSGDEDSMELRSDTACDSSAASARVTSDSGPPVLENEKLFEGPSPLPNKTPPLLAVEDLMSSLPLPESTQHFDASSFDSLDSLPTPSDDHPDSEAVDNLATPVAVHESPSIVGKPHSSLPSTPFPEKTQPVLGTVEAISIDREDLAPCDAEPLDYTSPPGWSASDQFPSPELPQPNLPRLSPSPLACQNTLTSLGLELDDNLEERRLSIFDWSEHQRSDRDSLYGSSPRPRTVHSKQGTDSRGGRPSGRRAPNTLHLRSQSLPAVKESYMDSDPAYPPTKFGTWGLGNKGVSEEWTDDFEFDEIDDNGPGHSAEGLGAAGMKVPQAIIDRQESVHANLARCKNSCFSLRSSSGFDTVESC